MGRKLAAAIAVAALAAGCGHARPAAAVRPPAQDPLVYKAKGNLRVVRAVVGDRLFILVFQHQAGVWFLVAAKPAADLPA